MKKINMKTQFIRLTATAAMALWSVSVLAQTNATAAKVAAAEKSGKKDVKVYQLAPSDVVEIRVFQEDDLLTKTRIASDGTITFPLVGVLKIGGQTVEQAAGMIKDLLAKDYLVNPQISVTVLEYSKRRFTVLGQVARPGPYEFPNEGTVDLVEAIGMAGGPTRIASNKAMVSRMKDGVKEVSRHDYKAMSKGKNAQPFEILPDDTITVEESIF
jgi:polysaccharide export outer membrane protein